MTVTYFGVTAATVRAEYFPMWTAFSGNTNPTSTTVTSSLIPQKYAELAGRLLVENVNAAAVDADTASVGYSWCQETLALMVAIRILQLATQRDPELAKTYEARLKERFDLLETYGAVALGDSTLDTGDSPANGPTTFITEMDISVPDDSYASGLAPFLRKDDPV